jgi:UDP-glucuronate 4-epimerase
MKILLTGCAGFIGSHTLDRLLADGHSVVGVDNFDPFYPRALKEANIVHHRENQRFELVEADLAERETLAKVKFIAESLPESVAPHQGGTTQGRVGACSSAIRHPSTSASDLFGDPAFDVVIHIAAKAGVRSSIEDPIGYQRANVIASQNLLEFAKDTGIPQFVFASSSSVYGVNPNVPWREDDHVLQPISPYASSKVSCELLGHVYSHLYGIRFLGLRFFTVFGPRQRPDLAINKFVRLIEARERIPVFGGGSTRRDYTYVTDVVDGILRAVHYDKTNYEVINLGNDRTVTLMDMISTIEKVVGKRAAIDRQPEQPGDVPQTWADISKARELLGYEPATGFEDGVAAFFDWSRSRIF